MNGPAKWTATPPSNHGPLCWPADNSRYLGVTLDNPPVMATLEDMSSIGRATRCLSEGRRIPLDAAVDLMEQGFDIASISRSSK